MSWVLSMRVAVLELLYSLAASALLLGRSPTLLRPSDRLLLRSPALRACSADSAVGDLPSCFLTGANYSRAVSAHRNTRTLLHDAANAFSTLPSAEPYAEDVVLRGDLAQELARGRRDYLAAFAAVARINGSPLLPLQAGELRADAEVDAGGESLLLRWRAPVRVTGIAAKSLADLGGGLVGGELELSGCSTYDYDAAGRFCAHTLSELAVNGRRLPSSSIGAWLKLMDQRSPSTAVAALALLAETLQLSPETTAATGGESVAAKSAAAGATVGGAAATAGGAAASAASAESAAATGAAPPDSWPASEVPPPPGSVGWPRYEACHRACATLAEQFGALLERAPEPRAVAALYADDVTLRSAAGGELLVQGREQYAQLLSSLTRAHTAVTASPLLSHTLAYRLSCGSSVGPWLVLGDDSSLPPLSPPPPSAPAAAAAAVSASASFPAAGAVVVRSGGSVTDSAEPPPRLTIEWAYSLQAAATPGRTPTRLFSLSASSDFSLQPAAAAAAAAATTEDDAAAAPEASRELRYVVQSHTLRQLTLNGRPALPAALLAQLGRAEASAPEVLQFFSSAFLTLSESLIPPVPGKPARPAISGALDAAAPMEFAVGFTSLLRSLHAQLCVPPPHHPLDCCEATTISATTAVR